MAIVAPPVVPKIPALLSVPMPAAPALCKIANTLPDVVTAVCNIQHI